MRITIAICTWNRAGILRQTLTGLTHLIIPPGLDWEVLVVNNNSNDDTDAVAASFAGRLPIRGLVQPQAGKSYALNLASQEARGDYIIWTDDDVLVEARWVDEYCRAFRRWPDAAAFGGPVAPAFAGPLPPWLHRTWPQISNAYAMIDWGPRPIPLSRDVVPFGVNMAVRTDWQRRYPYDPALGRAPGRRMGGEETMIIWAMLEAGATGWWVPTARVRHVIPTQRMSVRYLRNYFAGYGEFLGRYQPDRESRRLFGRPRWLWKDALRKEARYRLNRMTRTSTVWIEDLRATSIAWGKIAGYVAR